MIETLTSDYDEALKLKERIEELKIVRYLTTTDTIRGWQECIYMYSDDENEKKHRADMLLRGWNKVDSQSLISIYSNLYNGKAVRVPCGVYSRSVKSEI